MCNAPRVTGLAALLAALALAGPGAAQAQGLSVPDSWSAWHGKVAVGPVPTPNRSTALIDANPNFSLVGDYFFTRSLLGAGTEGGFRASSGLIVGPRSQFWSGQPGLGAASALAVGSRPFGTAANVPYLRDPSLETATSTYLGLGYTGLSARGGWSFSADLGVLAQSAGVAGRVGRVFGAGQNLDDVVRDLRLAPMFQMGVSYAF